MTPVGMLRFCRLAALLLLLAPSAAHATYNPVTGRFLNRDPIAELGGNNLYALGANDAVNHVDFLGEKVIFRVGMYGFNPRIPFIPSYGGEGEISNGADATFTSLDTFGAKSAIINAFDLNGDKRLNEKDCPPFVLNIVGYSWGGWSALDVANDLNHNGNGLFENIDDLKINIGLIDPVSTLRGSITGYKSHYSGGGGGYGKIPSYLVVDDPGVAIGQIPPNAREALEIYETKGLTAGLGAIVGGLFIGTKIEGFNPKEIPNKDHAQIISSPEAIDLILTIYSQE